MQVKVNGTSGTAEINPAPGSTVLDVMVEVLADMGFENPAQVLQGLSVVIDGSPAKLTDQLSPEAELVAVTPDVANG